MPYNIEFQLSGFIVIAILTLVFFSKKRWSSIQNTIYRGLLTVTLLELAFDIISVITITRRQSFPALNEFFSKGYLVIMVLYIYTVDLYTLANTLYEGISPARKRLKLCQVCALTAGLIAAIVVILVKPLLYGGSGRYIYSYGIPSNTVYLFSSCSVGYVILIMLVNMRKVPVVRQLSIYSFCIMEGIVAIVQMFNQKLLIVGFGSAAAVLIMYFTLENPDMHLISELNSANQKSHDLLLNILPASIAEKLQETNSTFTEHYDNITIMFLDIVNFSRLSKEYGAEQTVHLLNSFFSQIDFLLGKFRIEKIKTIGDAYMVAAGVPDYYEENCQEVLLFSLEILRLLKVFNKKYGSNINVRIGMNSGEVVAGIIGKKKFIYDLWGEAVNLASRMESYGVPGRINVSPSVYEKLRSKYCFDVQENILIKGFGEMSTYLLRQ